MTNLSVNLNKIAVLRNSRGDSEPDLLRAVRCVLDAGAHGITLHPRPDQRHVRPLDVRNVAELLATTPGIELNIEGNVFAAARDDYPGLLGLIERVRPTQCTLVPDGDAQITSDHGFDLRADSGRLRPQIARLKQIGCRVSLFVDAGDDAVEIAAEVGADRIELYTGPFARAHLRGDAHHELDRCRVTAERARRAGLGVNAGHDLNLSNLGALREAIPFLAEVSIGHALIGEALYLGLEATVHAYLAVLARTG